MVARTDYAAIAKYVGQDCRCCLVKSVTVRDGECSPTRGMKGTRMTVDHLGGAEAAEFGAKLDQLGQSLSPAELRFLEAALRLAGANLWAHTTGLPSGSSLQDLVIDIQQASAAHAISLNPLPIPSDMKGPRT
jgi:hypothetical protein